MNVTCFFRVALLLGFLCCPAGLALGQQWTRVNCPRAPLALAEQYETVHTLADFENGTAGWRAILGDQQARSDLSIEANGGREGRDCLRVNYEFVGRDEMEYVAFGPDTAIENSDLSIGFWYRFGDVPLRLRLRLTDRTGETHQLDLPRPAGDGWNFAAVEIESQGAFWGGDGNGRLDGPVRLSSIVADRPCKGFGGDGSLWIDDVAVLKTIERKNSLAIEGERLPLGCVYRPGETVRLRARGQGGEIRWTVRDFFGQVLDESAQTGSSATIEFPLAQPGYHECRVELARDGQVTDARLFSCAAIASATDDRRNTFVGMGCHFRRSAYPLECLDLLVRYGFGEFRDEISWSNVEAEKGQYVIPDYGQKFVSRANQLRLNPLLICDYSNRFYDEGGFPNSGRAVQAYARYCAALARNLRGKVDQFEIWNEWTIGCGMRDKPGENTPEAYAQLIQPAYQAIKRANSKATVVGLGGEHSANHFEEIRGMFQHGAADAMDAFSVHSYRYPRTPEKSGLVEEIRRVLELASDCGAPRRAWVTEIGWPTHTKTRGVDERTQARLCVRTLALLQSIKSVEKVYWYDFKDDGLKPDYNEHNFGVIRHDRYELAPKPAAVAASVYARMTAAAEPLRLWQHNDAYAVVFKCPDGDQTAVAWAVGGSPEIPVPEDVLVLDAMGNRKPERSRGALTEDPVYLKGKDLLELFENE